MEKKQIAVGSIIVVVLIAGIVTLSFRRASVTPQQASTYSSAALNALPKFDKSTIDTSHLATNLLPPTNRWFTGAVLEAAPKPIFPLPLKFSPTDTQFTFDMPKVTVNSKLIQAVDNLPVTVSPEGAHFYRVTRYDETSVDLTYYTENQLELATVTVTAGSPYIYVVSHGNLSLNVSAGSVNASRQGSAISFTANNKTILGVAPFEGAKITNVGTTSTVSAPSGSFVTLFAAPNASDLTKLMDDAGNRVVGTTVSFKHSGNNYVTSIDYNTANQKSTLYARLPQQGGNATGPQYDTIYGRVALDEGNQLAYQTKAIDLSSQLDVANVSSDQKQLLIETLKQDTTTLEPYPADTYFGGKMLYRDAQLLTFAKQLGQTTIASQLQSRIYAELSLRFTPGSPSGKSFYYDSKAHGIVGVTPAFGSEQFNDHHFHYGYFIYAASVLAQYDNDFKTKYQDQVNLLVADIANGVTDANFPIDRGFDPYFGHSWASGDSPFADGNNQESSSEAINAWIGMGLWAKQVGNSSMADRAGWLLSSEAAGTGAYWLNFDTSSYPYNAGYSKSVVSLNWGGKRDYATFFSSSPKAMLGIQLIPMSPTTASYLAPYGNRISQQLTEARNDQPDGQQFDDYLLMYQALTGNGSSLLSTAKALPDSAIDGANSRTYLYAWLFIHS